MQIMSFFPKRAQPCWTLLLLLSLVSSTMISTSLGGGIATYWGIDVSDGPLAETCNTGNYKVVNIAHLTGFGSGRSAVLNLAPGLCNEGNDCKNLENQIKQCQAQGVKVFLSIGGPADTTPYSLTTPKEATTFASELYTKYLKGVNGPLGRVVLDGIDFDIQDSPNSHWDELIKELHKIKIEKYGVFSFSAAPRCAIPDPFLGKAIQTGFFNYIHVRFFNNPSCEYSVNNNGPLFTSWGKWVGLLQPNNYLYMGLPSSSTDNSGYIEPQVMVTKVLPFIKNSPSYGGVTLWDTSMANKNAYSEDIKGTVGTLKSVTSDISNNISKCVSAALYDTLPKPETTLAI